MHAHLEDVQILSLGYKLENEAENLLGQLGTKEAMKGRTNDRHGNQRNPNGVPAHDRNHRISTVICPLLLESDTLLFRVRLTVYSHEGNDPTLGLDSIFQRDRKESRTFYLHCPILLMGKK